MSENIKDVLDSIKEAIIKNDDSIDSFLIDTEHWVELLDYITNLQGELEEKTYLYNKLDTESKYVITNLQEENERLKEQNNDLRRIYRNTYNRLFEKGNDELARYFQAQIDDCPTFYIEPIIDYYKECKDYKSRLNKAIEYIEENCIKSDKWKDLGFCNFVPTGKISYNSLSVKKVKDLLNILKGEE